MTLFGICAKKDYRIIVFIIFIHLKVRIDILLTEKGVRVTKEPKKTHPGKA